MFIPKTIDDVKRIVQERLQESHQLELKRQLPESGKNDDIAKDLAALANTEGGVIIYGVATDDDKRAAKPLPFKVDKAAERIDLVARSSVDEPLVLGPVETLVDDAGVGYLIVQVIQSDRAPHVVKGVVWGRTSSGNTPLTRREIGQLFARSPGFAQEFGLFLTRPGRVLVKNVRETHQKGYAGKTNPEPEYFLVFENDGLTDVREVDWSFVGNGGGARVPSVLENIFPLAVLPAGSPVRVKLTYSDQVSIVGLKVLVTWKDPQGNEHQQYYPVSR